MYTGSIPVLASNHFSDLCGPRVVFECNAGLKLSSLVREHVRPPSDFPKAGRRNTVPAVLKQRDFYRRLHRNKGPLGWVQGKAAFVSLVTASELVVVR